MATKEQAQDGWITGPDDLVLLRNPLVQRVDRDMSFAFMYHGQWVADCSRLQCFSAEPVGFREPFMLCTQCGMSHMMIWPTDAEAVQDVLFKRPMPATRNWAPPGHRQAVLSGHPDGQSVDDLRAENREHGVF